MNSPNSIKDKIAEISDFIKEIKMKKYTNKNTFKK